MQYQQQQNQHQSLSSGPQNTSYQYGLSQSRPNHYGNQSGGPQSVFSGSGANPKRPHLDQQKNARMDNIRRFEFIVPQREAMIEENISIADCIPGGLG